MSKNIELTRRTYKTRKKTSLNIQTQKTIKSLIVTLTSIIIILSGVFLFTTGEIGLKGNQLTQQKLRNQELKTESKELTQKITISASIKHQQEQQNVQKMATTNELTYITPEDNSIN
ncbi:hypothetical protein CVV38_04425 [Candidatus Peregrinibacteria bacterium HGW-Peregrinibacteria-1]|jgi:cell division protein FtsX|nr:MAG: hypothetical protein CVV38_04425 [Candidatus Peregrinibacteria bacterium HGW-Peregrinibacteria-1]